jgi:type I restriction enzyme M protein
LREDKRWKYGKPPVNNANYAWVQHFVHHLSPNGTAGFVLANGSMSSNTSGEGDIRKAIIEDDLVDCMVALPGQLFYSTQIPVCLWFLTRNKKTLKISLPDSRHVKQGSPANQDEGQSGKSLGSRDRRGEVLFIDARKLGTLTDRVHRDLSSEDIALIADTYHAWKSGNEETLKVSSPDSRRVKQGSPANQDEGQSRKPLGSGYQDVAGFCKSVTIEEIRAQGYVLTPGRYVGAAEVEEDDEPFEEKMARLTKELEAQFEENKRLEQAIRENLERIDYGLGK